MNNPYWALWLVPFQEIEVDHYLPAVHARISEAKSQISAIVQNPEPYIFKHPRGSRLFKPSARAG